MNRKQMRRIVLWSPSGRSKRVAWIVRRPHAVARLCPSSCCPAIRLDLTRFVWRHGHSVTQLGYQESRTHLHAFRGGPDVVTARGSCNRRPDKPVTRAARSRYATGTVPGPSGGPGLGSQIVFPGSRPRVVARHRSHGRWTRPAARHHRPAVESRDRYRRWHTATRWAGPPSSSPRGRALHQRWTRNQCWSVACSQPVVTGRARTEDHNPRHRRVEHTAGRAEWLENLRPVETTRWLRDLVGSATKTEIREAPRSPDVHGTPGGCSDHPLTSWSKPGRIHRRAHDVRWPAHTCGNGGVCAPGRWPGARTEWATSLDDSLAWPAGWAATMPLEDSVWCGPADPWCPCWLWRRGRSRRTGSNRRGNRCWDAPIVVSRTSRTRGRVAEACQRIRPRLSRRVTLRRRVSSNFCSKVWGAEVRRRDARRRSLGLPDPWPKSNSVSQCGSAANGTWNRRYRSCSSRGIAAIHRNRPCFSDVVTSRWSLVGPAHSFCPALRRCWTTFGLGRRSGIAPCDCEHRPVSMSVHYFCGLLLGPSRRCAVADSAARPRCSQPNDRLLCPQWHGAR